MSDLERAVAVFWQAIIARDAAAQRDVLAAYGAIRADLQPRVADLAARVIDDGVVDMAALQRMDRYQALLEQVDREMTALGGALWPRVQQEQRITALMGRDHSRALAGIAAGPRRAAVLSAWDTLPASALTDLVGRLRDGSPLRDWMRDLGIRTASGIESALIEGLGRGAGLRDIAATITRETDLAASRALLTTRDSILDSYRGSTLQHYAANSDIIDAWEWSAAHDSRVCRACLALDGRRFKLTQTFMPHHPGCRCRAVPVVKGVDQPREVGVDWLRRQPAAVQDRVLTRAGGADFRAGRIVLDDFVTLRRDPVWGDAYQAGSYRQARRRAALRQEAA